jgi:hypothetical protein
VKQTLGSAIENQLKCDIGSQERQQGSPYLLCESIPQLDVVETVRLRPELPRDIGGFGRSWLILQPSQARLDGLPVHSKLALPGKGNVEVGRGRPWILIGGTVDHDATRGVFGERLAKLDGGLDASAHIISVLRYN